jgi:hypothetical protein
MWEPHAQVLAMRSAASISSTARSFSRSSRIRWGRSAGRVDIPAANDVVIATSGWICIASLIALKSDF